MIELLWREVVLADLLVDVCSVVLPDVRGNKQSDVFVHLGLVVATGAIINELVLHPVLVGYSLHVLVIIFAHSDRVQLLLFVVCLPDVRGAVEAKCLLHSSIR